MTFTAINPEFSEYLRKHYEGLSNRRDQAAAALKAIYAYLQQKYPDLQLIEITYEGSGDSGQVESIYFNPGWFSGLTKLDVDDETMPDELSFGRKSQAGRWDMERREWISDAPDANPKLHELLDTFAWDLIYGQNPGFEINEGGFGTLSISGDGSNLDDITIKLNHSERVEHTNDYEHQF